MAAKLQVDETFEVRLRELREHAAAHDARRTGGRVLWYRPDGLDDPLDLDALGRPFDRTALSAAAERVLADADDPGTAGDAVLAHTELAVLSGLERAARARYTMTRCRAAAHAIARHRGHGDPPGAIGALVEYARGLAVEARAGG